MSLYSYVGEVTEAIYKFIQEQGDDHVLSLPELGLYGCTLTPMLAGRIMREYGHVVADDLRLVAKVRYSISARAIIIDPLNSLPLPR